MRVSLFITCLSDCFFPRVGQAVVHLLRRHGCDVDFPLEQVCCGQPAYNSGYHEEARTAAKQLIRAFKNAQYVVSPSGSCAAMIRHYYPTLFAADDEWRDKAQQFADKVYEFSQFMVNILKVSSVDACYEGRATYHHSCHMMRGLGIYQEPLQLLQTIKGLEVAELPYEQDCCGFGGTFAVKMKEISEQMVDEKVEHIRSTQADILVGSDMACLMNIEGRLKRLGYPVKVFHVAELLYEGVQRYESVQSPAV
ncbi:lactate utilization protein A [Caldalkalibacillus thermarum]|uniref:(Fe-S)-binding protein n=1 Tax=Caldalkalibacillus thermarum TaxID=296745 RepID=UPI00166953DA|nr:(Fe-S)-binding protein [Caldalkalibacillus thermarum]GGK28044.1 lactate utilization protein A [Caldalkalibacillus thermarum]